MPEHAVIFGPTEAGNYSQAAIFGNFGIAINIFGDQTTVNLELGHTILRRIEEIILESPEILPGDIIKMLQDEFAGDWQLNIIFSKIEGQNLTFAISGNTQAKVLRDGKTINITASVTGPIKIGDVVVLGTPTFFEKLFTPDIFENREDLALKLEALPDKLSLAALVLKIGDVNESETAPPPMKKDFFLRQSIPSSLIPQKSRRTLYAVLLVFVFLISLIAFQLRSKNLELRTKNEIAIENQANDGLNSAKKLAGLNDNVAREILTQAKSDLLSHATEDFGPTWQKDKTAESNRLRIVLADIDGELNIVSHIYALSNLDTFSDFALLRPGANITSASLNTNQMVVVDNANGAIYSLGTKSKTAAIVGGGEDFKKESYVDFIDNTVYVYTPVNIYSINSQTNTIKTLIKPSDKWGQIKGLKTFAGNLYLLDVSNNQIWKYQGTDFGFADIAPYLKGGADFSKTVSFSIEGVIYVLSSSGNVAAFAGGGGYDFSISGLDVPLKNPSSIFTTDETKNIYILDNGNSRVVVLDKKGVYQAQYSLPNVSSNLLLADETVGKVFLLSGSKVYSFDLKN